MTITSCKFLAQRKRISSSELLSLKGLFIICPLEEFSKVDQSEDIIVANELHQMLSEVPFQNTRLCVRNSKGHYESLEDGIQTVEYVTLLLINVPTLLVSN